MKCIFKINLGIANPEIHIIKVFITRNKSGHGTIIHILLYESAVFSFFLQAFILLVYNFG